jgi:glucose/arabinose dehydrogenase/mono/diheme cytochrome c family protein
MGRNFYLSFLIGLPLVLFTLQIPEPVPPAGHQPAGLPDGPYSTDKQVIARGATLFQNTCAGCHSFGQRSIGPDLAGITTTIAPAWISRYIRNAPAVLASGDGRARRLLAEYNKYMPPFPELSDADLRAITAYIHAQGNQSAEALATLGEPVADPVVTKITKAGLVLHLKLVTRAPATSTLMPATRINKMRVLTDGTRSRHFIQELRGVIYEVVNNKLKVFMDITRLRPKFIHQPGHGTGFGSFAFHPDFYKNGLFYTTHAEPAHTAQADFFYDSTLPVAMQWVLSEWQMDPRALTFTGTGREVMRINVLTQIHGMQELAFNPLAVPGSADYGLLYLSLGDGGAAEQKAAFLCNSNKTIWGSVLRINPLERTSANGKYGIPALNPYAQDGDDTTLGEIFARGFRNPNRFTWAPDGTMLIADIGLKNLEEVNIGQAGADYGWPAREGTFLVNYQGQMDIVYNLPEDDAAYPFTYPVAQYDHDEGDAMSGGVLYTSPEIPLLQGKYIFGDIVNGRVFFVNQNQLVAGQPSPIQEMELQLDGRAITFLGTTKYKKADLRFGLGPGQKLYLFTKTDGRIYQVTGCTQK